MPRKNALSPRQAAVCRRLRAFRMQTGLSRVVFAQRVGIDSSALARYEHARSPLPFEVFRSIAKVFPISPHWAADGTGEPTLPQPLDLSGFSLSVDPRALFSDVFDEHLAELIPADTTLGYALLKDILVDIPRLALWVSKYPKALSPDVVGAIKESFNQLLSALPENKLLTDASINEKTLRVKPLLPDLLARLRRATAQPGRKSELAKYLAAPPESVSRWLSENREPGGEVALKMQLWVQLQERLNENPERASTRPGQKTQLAHPLHHEKAKSGRKDK